MNKKLFTLGCMLIGATIANAQAPQKAAVYPVKTIQEIQFVSPQDLQAGNDASSIGATDTVRVRGVVIMDANTSTLVGGKQIWIQTNDGSPFSGLDIYQNFPGTGVSGDAGTGILSLVAGDSVEITGRVEEFQGETEFIPINTSPATPIQLLDAGKVVKSKLILASELNDPSRNNILTTGEQYEGMYVELQNMTVSSVDYFSNGARVSFNITDNSGNKVNVSDRFLAMKIVASGGSFYPPNGLLSTARTTEVMRSTRSN
jgi:predicted extracellular nuclease